MHNPLVQVFASAARTQSPYDAGRCGIQDLMQTLSDSELYFVLCVRPAPPSKASGPTFDAPFVLQQLRAGGGLDTAAVFKV